MTCIVSLLQDVEDFGGDDRFDRLQTELIVPQYRWLAVYELPDAEPARTETGALERSVVRAAQSGIEEADERFAVEDPADPGVWVRVGVSDELGLGDITLPRNVELGEMGPAVPVCRSGP